MSSGIVKGFPLNRSAGRPPTRPVLPFSRLLLVSCGICNDVLLFSFLLSWSSAGLPTAPCPKRAKGFGFFTLKKSAKGLFVSR